MEEVTEDVVDILLNGITIQKFIAFYIVGLVGAFLSFGINVGLDVRFDKTTPNKFKRATFKVKAIRWVTTLLLLAVGIVFNKEILAATLDSASTIELKTWTALLVGMSTDQLGKTLSGIKNKK